MKYRIKEKLKKGTGYLIPILIIILSFVLIISCSSGERSPSKLKVKVPAKLSYKDFQAGFDKKITEHTKSIFNIEFVKKSSEWMFKEIHDPIVITELRYTSLEVVNDQFPGLRKLVNDICEVLHIDKEIKVFIYQDKEMNAFVTNVDSPCLALSSTLVNYMPKDELIFVIGHELGHIKCDHVLIQMIFKLLQDSLKTSGYIKSKTIELFVSLGFLKILRTSEEMADRAGLIACQDIEIAERALLRLLSDNRKKDFYKHINIDQFLEETKRNMEDENLLASLRMQLVLLHQSHPFLPTRMLKIKEYSDSENYKSIFNDTKRTLTYNLK